ncbi:MAG: hypothetical protein E7351_03055 [Clostridiales bacterium]|nr:hypothetical protein [Clostridiales bacterium]
MSLINKLRYGFDPSKPFDFGAPVLALIAYNDKAFDKNMKLVYKDMEKISHHEEIGEFIEPHIMNVARDSKILFDLSNNQFFADTIAGINRHVNVYVAYINHCEDELTFEELDKILDRIQFLRDAVAFEVMRHYKLEEDIELGWNNTCFLEEKPILNTELMDTMLVYLARLKSLQENIVEMNDNQIAMKEFSFDISHIATTAVDIFDT